MTEKEKMQKGLEFSPMQSQELMVEMLRAKNTCFEYNQTKPSETVRRKEIIQSLFGKTEGEFLIEQPFHCDYGYNIEIGSHFYANHNLVILDGAKVKIGDQVQFGPNCGIYTAGHPVDIKKRRDGLECDKPITIGNNVWLGGNTVVLPGITIGDNSVIGAGSVVTKDIPPNVVAVGNPCKVVKKIENEEGR